MGKHWGTNLNTIATYKGISAKDVLTLLDRAEDGIRIDITVKADKFDWEKVFSMNVIRKVECNSKEHKYVLDFELQKYTRDNKKFYLTNNEAITIYFYSVCGVKLPHFIDTIYALRLRMGDSAFLSDFLEMYQEGSGVSSI